MIEIFILLIFCMTIIGNCILFKEVATIIFEEILNIKEKREAKKRK